MSLIVCTECGKSFSDKASLCPECGCPTEVVLKEINSGNYENKQKQNQQYADKEILKEIKRAKKDIDNAESIFNDRNYSIQLKASQSLDLFEDDFVARVVEIKAEARIACDELFATYQSLITTIDAFCRPLLKYNPSASVLKKVKDIISYLNEESKIENTFNSSFNGSSLGTVLSTKYVPYIENELIQKYWERIYDATPEAIEEKRIKKQKAEEQRIKNIERRRQEELKRKNDAEITAKQKKHMEKICEDCNEKVLAYKENLEQETRNYLTQIELSLKENEKKLRIERIELEKRLSSLKMFQLREKNEIKDLINIIDIKIKKISNNTIIKDESERLNAVIQESLKEYQSEMNKYLDARFPNRKKDNKNKYIESNNFDVVSYPEAPLASMILKDK